MTKTKQIPKAGKPLADRKASQFSFKSRLAGPISDLTFLQRSLLFAEVSMISYLSIEECNVAAGKLGFVDGKFFNSTGTQAYWYESEHDSVIVFRGTEVNDWNDLKADANAIAAVAETVGRVHRGFKAEADEIWPHLEKELEVNTKPLWFCGHSLGGAMASICAGRCMLSYLRSEPEELYTFGSPRVGCKRYVNHVKLPHFRWVNNNDIVTRVPPTWLGYRHSGTEIYLNRSGQLSQDLGWQRVSDRFQGFIDGLWKFRIDQLADHSVIAYIDRIFDLLRNEKTQTKPPVGTVKPVEKAATAASPVSEPQASVSEPQKASVSEPKKASA